jgi:predicted dehydrogenase
MRVGVAGVGRLGREHARILAEMDGAQLSAVHDADADRGAAVGAEFGVRHVERLDDLLDSSDALVVAVPTASHHPVARRALEAGLHVLVEKPVARTLEEADDLIAVAEQRGLRLAVGHVERFNGAIRSSERYLNGPRFIESLRLSPFQPRGTDVNVVLDLMIHDIDLVLGLVRAPVASLHAVGTPVLTGSVDIANARLVFENGAVAEITASRVSEERLRVLRLFQADGYLKLDLAAGGGEFLRRREGAAPWGGEATANGGPRALSDLVEHISFHGDGREPLRLELEAFLSAVRGDASSVVSAREGRAALEVAFRIGQSIQRFADVALETS